MYQELDDKELIEFVFKNVKENLIEWLECDLKNIKIYLIRYMLS